MEDAKLFYSEVLGVILALGNKYMDKTPPHIIKFLRKNCDYSKIPEIDGNIRLEDQNISEDSKMFIMLLKFNYWCESEDERKEMYSLMKNNEIKHQKELEEKYNIDNIFKKDNKESKAMVKQEKNSLLDKIKTFLKKIFKKN
ncbi:MAG: hypothetical protein IKE91_07860 [Clostridia bacterium]|nr:hypothetical protein [Clostridia bacterium]